MKVQSFGHRSDLFFLRHQAEVLDRGDFLACRSPAEPGYHWGNFLLLADPPVPGDLERWVRLFDAEFADLPEVRHQAFSWDETSGERGAADEFLAAGFRWDGGEVMVSRRVGPPRFPAEGVELRPMRTEADWEASARCAVLVRDARFSEASYQRFVMRRQAAQRELVERGLGQWFGAFLDGALVADLGLFLDGELARYQRVQTHPDHRRKGLCATLVTHAAEWARRERGAEVFLLVADPGGAAGRVYRSLGFEVEEVFGGLVRAPET